MKLRVWGLGVCHPTGRADRSCHYSCFCSMPIWACNVSEWVFLGYTDQALHTKGRRQHTCGFQKNCEILSDARGARAQMHGGERAAQTAGNAPSRPALAQAQVGPGIARCTWPCSRQGGIDDQRTETKRQDKPPSCTSHAWMSQSHWESGTVEQLAASPPRRFLMPHEVRGAGALIQSRTLGLATFYSRTPLSIHDLGSSRVSSCTRWHRGIARESHAMWPVVLGSSLASRLPRPASVAGPQSQNCLFPSGAAGLAAACLPGPSIPPPPGTPNPNSVGAGILPVPAFGDLGNEPKVDSPSENMPKVENITRKLGGNQNNLWIELTLEEGRGFLKGRGAEVVLEAGSRSGLLRNPVCRVCTLVCVHTCSPRLLQRCTPLASMLTRVASISECT